MIAESNASFSLCLHQLLQNKREKLRDKVFFSCSNGLESEYFNPRQISQSRDSNYKGDYTETQSRVRQ